MKEKGRAFATEERPGDAAGLTLPSAEGSAHRVEKVRRKAGKKRKYVAETEQSATAASATETDDLARPSRVKRRHAAASDRHSGVVRVIDTQRHRRKAENIEEALLLDVGVGSSRW